MLRTFPTSSTFQIKQQSIKLHLYISFSTRCWKKIDANQCGLLLAYTSLVYESEAHVTFASISAGVVDALGIATQLRVQQTFVHIWHKRLTQTRTRSSVTAEIARVGGRYAVQGHSRSLMLVPIESQYATSHYSTILADSQSRTITKLLKISEIFALDRGVASGGTSL